MCSALNGNITVNLFHTNIYLICSVCPAHLLFKVGGTQRVLYYTILYGFSTICSRNIRPNLQRLWMVFVSVIFRPSVKKNKPRKRQTLCLVCGLTWVIMKVAMTKTPLPTTISFSVRPTHHECLHYSELYYIFLWAQYAVCILKEILLGDEIRVQILIGYNFILAVIFKISRNSKELGRFRSFLNALQSIERKEIER